jgi:hypothetical protein
MMLCFRTKAFWIGWLGCAAAVSPCVAQVFVVGEKTATADIPTDFKPTRLRLSDELLSQRTGDELMRTLVGEQGFAHRPLPLGASLTLRANGQLDPGSDAYKKLIYKKGQAAGAGERVAITAMDIKPDRIVFDLNGGPYPPHRFLSHVQIDDMNLVANPMAQATGSRITLVFEGGVPEISAPELKVLLQPLLDFGAKTAEKAYAETLPEPVKDSIEAHDVLVGMNHRMVLAALGQPEQKMRERDDNDPNGPRYEEWIYGHVPETVKFVRFDGDRVSLVKVAAMGKPIEIHDKDELAGYLPPPPVREIAEGDQRVGDDDHPKIAPTLRRPGDPVTPGQNNRQVQFPTAKPAGDAGATAPAAGSPPTA